VDNTEPVQPGNVQRQLAIFNIVKRAQGRSMAEIQQMLRDAFARRRLSIPSGTWLDAVATEASYGKPYLVDLPSAVAADNIMAAPDPQVEEDLQLRRRLRASETSPSQRPGRTGNAAPRSRVAAATRRLNNATARRTVATAVTLALAIAATAIVRAKLKRRSR
jgi:hypothetical protein